MATCRTCGAAVTWVLTASGKRMPVDPIPIAGGNIELTGEVATYVKPDSDTKRYVSHFATCPDALDHRKKK